MIIQINNPLFIPKIIDLAKSIPDTNVPALEKMLIDALTSKKAKIYVAEKDNEVIGFIFGSVEEIDGEDCVFIQSTYIRPDKEERYIGFEFMTKMRLFAQENKIKYIYMLTKRNPKPYIKKYHFSFAYTMLRREV